MLSITHCIHVLLYLIHIAFCALQFQQPEDLPAVNYDFVIVGGGTAGVVVASRLSENPNFKVLIIEAGPSNDEVFETQVPGLMNKIKFGTRVDWNYTIVPQIHVNGNAPMYPRAMMLGGCSSHNGMVYTRGSRDDYDRWASIVDDDSLSWNNILPFILRTEKWSGPNDPSLREQGHFEPSVHNFHGKVEDSAAYGPHPLNNLLFEAATDAEGEFPFLLDQNDGRPIGISWGQFTTANGTRSSSATGYLPHTGDNLHVLLNTRVMRILPLGGGGGHSNGGEPIFRKVEFATNASAPIHSLTVTKEVVVSGGVFNSPQILLTSGIGPKDDLERLGIDVNINNPGVGRNLTDQLAVSINFTTNLPLTDDFNVTTALSEWTVSHTGPLAVPLALSAFGWVRLPDDAEAFRNSSPDPTAGPNSPHIELEFFGITPQTNLTGMGNPQEGKNSLRAVIVNLHPFSRGSVTINTSSPFSPPLIDMNLLSSPFDEPILIEGVFSVLRLFASPAFSKNIFGFIASGSPPDTIPTRQQIAEIIETHAVPFGHAVGGCNMAPRGAKWGVVDPDFRVKGTRGLRVVDASVIPYVTSGHTQAPVYALAEWASDIIKKAWE